MIFRRLTLGAVLVLALGAAGAWAEPVREVPETRPQVQLSFAPIVKRVVPAVVNIYTSREIQQRAFSPFMADPFFQQFFGGRLPQGGPVRKRLENSLGSGVLVRADGLIVTSNHVIDGADEIKVVLSDRREFEAKLVSADEHTDLALLQIEAKGERFPFLEIKDSDEVEVGDLVLAIGNPFGVGQTVTSGIVSANARTSLDINDVNYYIQTDAAINPGNSGGALVGMDGRLIGINAAIYTKDGGNMGLGFAVPSNMVRATLASISGQHGKIVVRPWTGIGGQEVDAAMASSLSLSKPSGLVVNSLHKESPARKAGLAIGDVILDVNGKPVDSMAALNYRIATMGMGQTVAMDIVRKGQPVQVSFPLMPPPESPAREVTLLEGKNPLAGLKIANLSPAVAEEYGLRGVEEGGVVIVDSGKTRSFLGLGRGDIILSINDEEVKQVKDAVRLLAAPARGWKIMIRRGGSVMTMVVRG